MKKPDGTCPLFLLVSAIRGCSYIPGGMEQETECQQCKWYDDEKEICNFIGKEV